MVDGKRILIASWGSYGDVNPYVGLAIALKARGHLPVIATSLYYREYIEREGIAFHPVRPDVNPNDRAIIARIMDPRRGTEFILRDLLLPHLRESWEDLSAAADGAGLILTHPVTFAGPIIANERGLPWLSTVLAPMSFFSAHDPPVVAPMPWVKRLDRIPFAARLLVSLSKRATRPWLAPVRRLRRQRGLPPAGHPLFEGQHSPDGVLALFSRQLAEPQPDWPPNAHVTGHIFYNGPARAQAPGLAAFLEDGPPPIVFTLGSSAVATAGEFYEVSIAAARKLGARAVLLTGSHPENRPGAPLPRDVIAVEYAPHETLFPRASVVVHQGGIGTLAQALRAGRPMLVVPWSHDQPDNAHRAARLGVARVLYPARYRVPAVVRQLGTLLRDPATSDRARAVGRAVSAENGLDAACDVIENRLASVVPRSR